ncbi:Hypothetical_protein [Hexamita inflata]|uniref:Hypothetical_protein n=1 Tax=Hexamita inflata TaxID=28002 RepID=A0AA86UYE2_9EUKA|nr:Hypothetical protein HINF_LOCUS60629 [Hexamita inflata]
MDSDDYDDYNDYDNYNDYEDYNDYNNNYDSDSNNFDEFNDFCDGNSNQEEYSNNNYDNSNDIDSIYDSEYDYNNYVKQQTIKQVKTQTNNKESLKTQIKNTTQQCKLQTENGEMQHLKKDQNKIDQKILNETIKSMTLKFTVSNAEEMIFKIEKRLGIKRHQFMHGNPNISLKKLKDQKDEKQQQNESKRQQVLQFQVIEKYKEPIKRYFWQQLDRAQKDPSIQQQTIQESIKFTVSNASVTIKKLLKYLNCKQKRLGILDISTVNSGQQIITFKATGEIAPRIKRFFEDKALQIDQSQQNNYLLQVSNPSETINLICQTIGQPEDVILPRKYSISKLKNGFYNLQIWVNNCFSEQIVQIVQAQLIQNSEKQQFTPIRLININMEQLTSKLFQLLNLPLNLIIRGDPKIFTLKKDQMIFFEANSKYSQLITQCFKDNIYQKPEQLTFITTDANTFLERIQNKLDTNIDSFKYGSLNIASRKNVQIVQFFVQDQFKDQIKQAFAEELKQKKPIRIYELEQLSFKVINADQMIKQIQHALNIKQNDFMHGNPSIIQKKNTQLLQFWCKIAYNQQIKQYFKQYLTQTQQLGSKTTTFITNQNIDLVAQMEQKLNQHQSTFLLCTPIIYNIGDKKQISLQFKAKYTDLLSNIFKQYLHMPKFQLSTSKSENNIENKVVQISKKSDQPLKQYCLKKYYLKQIVVTVKNAEQLLINIESYLGMKRVEFMQGNPSIVKNKVGKEVLSFWAKQRQNEIQMFVSEITTKQKNKSMNKLGKKAYQQLDKEIDKFVEQ